MDNTIKISLAILLFLCLADMPYGYYELVRFSSLVGFSILAYLAHKQNKQSEMIFYASLALLFQPFFKIALGKQIWQIVDVIVAFVLIFSILKRSKR